MAGGAKATRKSSHGSIEFQNIPRFNWSGERQFFWKEGKTEDHIDPLFYSADSLTVPVTAAFTYAPDYGTFRLEMNGKPLPGEYNLYNDAVITREGALGTLPVKKGRNQLRAVITGTSGIGGKAFLGIDYLKFE